MAEWWGMGPQKLREKFGPKNGGYFIRHSNFKQFPIDSQWLHFRVSLLAISKLKMANFGVAGAKLHLRILILFVGL
jgi:hypothetical protein